MGSSNSKTTKIIVEIAQQVGATALQLVLEALLSASAAEKLSITDQDPVQTLQSIVNSASQDCRNKFGENFKYIYNGPLSKPPYYTDGLIIADQDFTFYSPNNPDLNNVQQYIGSLLQPMTSAGYDTDTISLDVSGKLQEVFAAGVNVWSYYSASYDATKVDKTCQVDFELLSCNVKDSNGDSITFCAVTAVIYDSESLTAMVRNLRDYRKRSEMLSRAKCFIWMDDTDFSEISQEVAGYLKDAASNVAVVNVYGTYDVSNQLFGNISGTTNDRRANWKSLWIKNTGLAWPLRCAHDQCSDAPTVGGHTFFKVSGTEWFIVPICHTHNSTMYNGNSKMTARRGTKAIRIDPIPLLDAGWLTGVAKEVALARKENLDL